MLAISGSLIALFGVVLTIVSTSSFLNSSSFFQLTGLGLILSGALLAKRHIAGAWTYLAVVAATLSWSLHDVGRGGSTVAYRIAGPIIMLAMIALIMPTLLRWSRGRTVAVLTAFIMATLFAGDLLSSAEGPLESPKLASSQFHDDHKNGVLQ